MVKRVFGYVRTSTPAQTVEEQQHMIEEWAESRLLSIAEIFVDRGVSGAVPFANRPGGRRLFQTVQDGDVIVAPWLDRLFRSANDCLEITQDLQKRGVGLYLFDFNNGGEDISAKTISRLLIHAASAFAEFEKSRIAERIRAAKRAQKALGHYMGGNVPWGWRLNDTGSLVAIPEKQSAIAKMREMRNQGISLRQISRQMKASGMSISPPGVVSVLKGSTHRWRYRVPTKQEIPAP